MSALFQKTQYIIIIRLTVDFGHYKKQVHCRCLNFENQGKIVKSIDSVNLLNVGTLAAVTFLYYCAL